MGPEKIKPVKSEYTLLKVMGHYCKERDWGSRQEFTIPYVPGNEVFLLKISLLPGICQEDPIQ